MAGFKCDICGGDIKMQANKTGVCQTCGMQYDLEAIRAMLGQQSAPVQPVPQPAAAPKTTTTMMNDLSEIAPINSLTNSRSSFNSKDTKDEIDRETLLSYLGDIRVMETILKESQNSKEQIERDLEDWDKSKQSYITPFYSSPPREPIKPYQSKTNYNPDSKVFYFPYSKFKIVGAILMSLLFLLFIIIFAKGLGGFFVFLLVCCFLFSVGLTIYLINYNMEAKRNHDIVMNENERKEQKYKEELEEHKEKMIEYRKKHSAEELEYRERRKVYEEERKQHEEEKDKLIGTIQIEDSEIKAMLEKAYSANIIPQQFRNIEGVYYLYDYLSTSNQSLSEALMQANLEAIKQKMDNMIKLQSAQIIQQAQMNAKLDIQNKKLVSMQAQTNAKLDAIIDISEATMNNTAVAAKYAQIAAVNSELNVKLAAESLAYQKAAFWLK